MSMMNANAAATTAMTTNEPLDFVLPEMGDADFSSEELAEDTDGLTMSFPRIKIPAGGVLQFEIPNGDPQHPDYRPTLTGVILYNHASCAYWPEGDEYNDDVPPLCSSVDGKQGYGEPGGTCATCTLSQFGSASNGRGKACKNMRVLYLLRSGEFMLSLFLLYVRLAFSFYCQNHISSELVLAYIIFGYAIVLFYHFCTPIIFSSMGILVVNDSDKESCRIEN